MDLSGLIFVVLAVAWAGYLIPRALRRHEDVAANRPFDGFSDSVRVLGRTSATARTLLATTPPPAPAVTTRLAPAEPKRPSTLVRPTTRGAAVRRRRVLLVLLVVTAATAGAAGLGYLAWAWVAAPGAAVVAWLVLGVLMSRRTRPVAARPALEVIEGEAPAPVVDAAGTVPVLVEEDDALWDPLPITLPTYVGKPVARRTVRTIELTRAAVTSAGHLPADSALARRAEADEKAARAAAAAEPTGPMRKVAGA